MLECFIKCLSVFASYFVCGVYLLFYFIFACSFALWVVFCVGACLIFGWVGYLLSSLVVWLYLVSLRIIAVVVSTFGVGIRRNFIFLVVVYLLYVCLGFVFVFYWFTNWLYCFGLFVGKFSSGSFVGVCGFTAWCVILVFAWVFDHCCYVCFRRFVMLFVWIVGGCLCFAFDGIRLLFVCWLFGV